MKECFKSFGMTCHLRKTDFKRKSYGKNKLSCRAVTQLLANNFHYRSTAYVVGRQHHENAILCLCSTFVNRQNSLLGGNPYCRSIIPQIQLQNTESKCRNSAK